MRAHVVTLTAAIVVAGAGAAYAANETVTMTAIDANGAVAPRPERAGLVG